MKEIGADRIVSSDPQEMEAGGVIDMLIEGTEHLNIAVEESRRVPSSPWQG